MKRIALLLCLLFTPPVAAHDYRLVPEGFNIEGGANVPVRVYVGESLKAGQEVVYSPKRTAAPQLVYSGKTVTEFPDLNDGGKPALAFKMPTTGTAVFRYDRDWSSLTLKVDKFTAYLKEEGLDAIIQARAAANEAEGDEKECYRRCLKDRSWVRQAGRHAHKAGQVLEIVPGKGPYTLEAGEELPVKMLFEEQPHAGAKVTAYHRR